MVSGVGHGRLLRSSDRTEVLVEGMLVNLVVEHQRQIREAEINMMANEIAKRFNG